MGIALAYSQTATVTRTQTGPGVGSDNTTTVNGYNTTFNLSGSTSPAVTKDAAFNVTLSGGAATINLAALVDTDLGTVDGTGLKIQVIKFKNAAAAAMTVAKGASNGHTGLGSAFSVTIPPGGEVTIHCNDGGADIASGDRTLDVTGTGSQVLGVQVVMG